MKKLFNFVINFFSFGIPLFIRVLSRNKELKRLADEKLEVTLGYKDNSKKVVHIENHGVRLLTLEVDSDTTQDKEEAENVNFE